VFCFWALADDLVFGVGIQGHFGDFYVKVVRCCIWLAALQQNLICSFVDGIFLLYLYTLTFK
jgi:hypothetical protein